MFVITPSFVGAYEIHYYLDGKRMYACTFYNHMPGHVRHAFRACRRIRGFQELTVDEFIALMPGAEARAVLEKAFAEVVMDELMRS